MPKNRKCEGGPVTGYVYENADWPLREFRCWRDMEAREAVRDSLRACMRAGEKEREDKEKMCAGLHELAQLDGLLHRFHPIDIMICIKTKLWCLATQYGQIYMHSETGLVRDRSTFWNHAALMRHLFMSKCIMIPSPSLGGHIYEPLDNKFFYGCCSLNEVEVKMDLAVV